MRRRCQGWSSWWAPYSGVAADESVVGDIAVTTAPTAMIAPWPMRTPGMTVTPWPNHPSLPTTVSPRPGRSVMRSKYSAQESPVVGGRAVHAVVGAVREEPGARPQCAVLGDDEALGAVVVVVEKTPVRWV